MALPNQAKLIKTPYNRTAAMITQGDINYAD